MVSSGIMNRRKRAQIGTILAILMILLPLPAGAYLYNSLSGFGDLQRVYAVNDEADDALLDASYDNETGLYTYTKKLDDGTNLSSYSSDVAALNYAYKNSSGNVYRDSLSYTAVDNGIFLIPQQIGLDGDEELTFSDSSTDYRPTFSIVTTVSPGQLQENGVDKIRAYWENGQDVNITALVGVYDADLSVPDDNNFAGVSLVSTTGCSDLYNNYYIMHEAFRASSNGTWVDIEIPETSLLTASTLHGDGYVFISFLDTDSGTISEVNGIVLDVEMYGNAIGVTMGSYWHAALIAIGTFGLLGAVIATPYVSLESLSMDGMQGNRYRKGNNPRPNNKRSRPNNSRRRR